MSDAGPRLERFLERAAGLGVGSQLHPSVFIQQVHLAAERSIRGGAIANAYTVELAPADAAVFGPYFEQLADAARETLDALVASRGLQKVSQWQFDIASDDGVRPGSAKVRADFRHAATAAPTGKTGPTRAITRHRDTYLIVNETERVRLTHTPATIGRNPDCDLTIADLSISRRHALIETGPNGELVMRDLGSRNKLVVDGAAVDSVRLEPGVVVKIGSTTIRLEAHE